MESNTLREEEITLPHQLDPLGESPDHINPYGSSKMSKQALVEDPLGKLCGLIYFHIFKLFLPMNINVITGIVLNVNVLDSRLPHIPFEEFYNETLSDAIEMDQDFSCYRCKYKKSHFIDSIDKNV